MKLYERTENGTTTRIPLAEGLAVINYAQMDGKRFVRSMSYAGGHAQIEYKNGIKVTLRQIEIEDPQESAERSEEHTYELQSLMRISYAVFCLKKQNQHN